MTRDALGQRLVELGEQRDQALATLNAILGAIQECQYWLAQLDAPREAAYTQPVGARTHTDGDHLPPSP